MFPDARDRQAVRELPSPSAVLGCLGIGPRLRVWFIEILGFVSGLMTEVMAAWKLSPLLLSPAAWGRVTFDTLPTTKSEGTGKTTYRTIKLSAYMKTYLLGDHHTNYDDLLRAMLRNGWKDARNLRVGDGEEGYPDRWD